MAMRVKFDLIACCRIATQSPRKWKGRYFWVRLVELGVGGILELGRATTRVSAATDARKTAAERPELSPELSPIRLVKLTESL